MDFSFLNIMIENFRSTNKADTLSMDVQWHLQVKSSFSINLLSAAISRLVASYPPLLLVVDPGPANIPLVVKHVQAHVSKIIWDFLQVFLATLAQYC